MPAVKRVELNVVARRQRKSGVGPCIDHLPELGGFRLEHRCFTGHFDRSGHVANLKPKIDFGNLIHLQCYVGLRLGLKSGRFHFNGVSANRDFRNPIKAFTVGGSRILRAPFRVGRGYLTGDHGGARGIRHVARDSGSNLLT